METFAALTPGVLLAVLGFTLGLLQRRPAQRVAVPLSLRPVASVVSMVELAARVGR